MDSLYQHLPSGYVRLLTFSDDTGTICTLEEISLEDAPSYACLSYAWESEIDQKSNPHPFFSIIINGQEKLIRRNLYEALSHLGPIARAAGHQFWVDALCINQEDLEERAEQVKLMKRLYEEAASVMAWTGLPTADTELAMGLLHTLNEFPQEIFNRYTTRDALFFWEGTLSKASFFQHRSESHVLAAWADVVQLFKRVYWGRAWVHQEITGPNVTFYCGQWSFTWKELQSFNKFHGTYGGLRDMPEQYMLMLSGGVNTGAPFFDLWSAQRNRSACLKSKDWEQRLLVLIRELRLTFCSDARDKIFAALPHATDIKTPDAKGLLSVDYSKSATQTFIDVARFHLLSGDLDILGYIGAKCPHHEYRPPPDPEETPLPSWVPDWRIPYRIRPLNTAGRVARDYSMIYNPCPHTSPEISIVGSEVRIKGFMFDELRSVVLNSGRDYVPSQLKIKWSKEMKAWSSSSTQKDITRVLNADVQWNPDDEDRRRGEIFDWDLLEGWINKLTKEQQAWRYNMRHILRSVCRDRRAGCTEAGSIGIFPEAALPGDRVAAFHGGHALYVIRPVEDRQNVYEFIGECYVDQMMDGQVMDLAEKEGLTASTLNLV